MGSLWGWLLGLLPDLRLHLDFELSVGLAALSRRFLELLLLRLGMVAWRPPRRHVGSGECGARPSPRLDDAASPSGRRPAIAGTAGCSRPWTGCPGPVGVQSRNRAQTGSSASAELEWTHHHADWPDRRSSAGIYRCPGHRAGISRSIERHFPWAGTALGSWEHLPVGCEFVAPRGYTECEPGADLASGCVPTAVTRVEPQAERGLSRAVV